MKEDKAMYDDRMIDSKEKFKEFVEGVESSPGYCRPVAFALGLATMEDGIVISVENLVTNYEANYGTAAVLAWALSLGEAIEPLSTGGYILDDDAIANCLEIFAPFIGEPGHKNVEAMKLLSAFLEYQEDYVPFLDSIANPKRPVLSVVMDWDDNPVDVEDIYLKLYALSERFKQPNTVNLDGAFGILKNLIFTEAHGVFTPETWKIARKAALIRGESVRVSYEDKLPRLLDHVVVDGVRIVDGARTRLGAYLGEGSVVMPNGYVNFNAGSLGTSMIEGAVSQGVVIGDGTDVGDGATIIGTLSGGGTTKISIGKKCLIEAGAVVGIPLGDNCRVAANLAVTESLPVMLPTGWAYEKATEFSGQDNLTFRRDSKQGSVEALYDEQVNEKWGGLNSELHKND